MGLKVIKLDDVEVSVVLTGLTLVHTKYFNDKDKESMLLSDKLLDLIKDSDIYIGEVNKK